MIYHSLGYSIFEFFIVWFPEYSNFQSGEVNEAPVYISAFTAVTVVWMFILDKYLWLALSCTFSSLHLPSVYGSKVTNLLGQKIYSNELLFCFCTSSTNLESSSCAWEKQRVFLGRIIPRLWKQKYLNIFEYLNIFNINIFNFLNYSWAHFKVLILSLNLWLWVIDVSRTLFCLYTLIT